MKFLKKFAGSWIYWYDFVYVHYYALRTPCIFVVCMRVVWIIHVHNQLRLFNQFIFSRLFTLI